MNKKKWVTSLLALSLVSSFSAAPVFADGGHGKKHDNGLHLGWAKQKVNFQDIDDNFSWARQAIQKLAEEGIIAGMDATHFQPAGKLNRAQFAVLVSRFFGLQPADLTHEDFLDVHNGDWYFRDIEAAKNYMTWFTDGSGYDFRPNQAINRAEAAVTLVQLLMKNNSIQLVSQSEADQILSVYKDAYQIPENLRIHVATAIKAGVIKGVATDRFDPLSTLNRAQAATLLYRLQTDITDPTTGAPIEVVPGTPDSTNDNTNTDTSAPILTYASSSYTVPVGNEITVRSNELGNIYLIPAAYSVNSVSSLDSLVNSNIAVRESVDQVNTNVYLSTSNLAAGDYVIYTADSAGNISRFVNTIHLTSTGTSDTTAPTITYESSSYNLKVGDAVDVRSSERGTVYLVSSSSSPDTVSELDSLINSNKGVRTSITTAGNQVSLDTTNLAAGDYTLYAVDLSGNIAQLGHTINLADVSAITTVQIQSNIYDNNTGETQLTAGVQTRNVDNNTEATFELVNTDGSSLNPTIRNDVAISNNNASTVLDIPANLQAGYYKVKVTVAGDSELSSSFYVK